MTDTELAKILWLYHWENNPIQSADYAIGFGSHDLNVPKRAADLYHQGLVKKIIFSGGFGRITKKLWHVAEADKFKEIALAEGVPEKNLIIETKATNTGENIDYIKDLLGSIDFKRTRFIVIDKPYREKRTYATLKKQWPELNFQITSPDMTFEDYLTYYQKADISYQEFYSIMVGDLQRILLYPKAGFQIPLEVPETVLDAYNQLIELGYTQHLLKK